MKTDLALRQVDPAACALRNRVLAARAAHIDLASLKIGEPYVAFDVRWKDEPHRAFIALQQLLDLWLGEASLPAEQIESDIALRFVQECLAQQGLPSPDERMQWLNATGFAGHPDDMPPLIRLRSGPFDLFLDGLPATEDAIPVTVPELPIEAHWVLDTVPLTTADIAALTPGDVIVITAAYGCLRAGDRPLFCFHLLEDFLMLEETFAGLGPHSDDEDTSSLDPLYAPAETQDAGPPDRAAAAIESLPVSVSLILGKRTMTVAEIGGLQAGMTIPLEDVSPYVTLMAGNVVLGQGELVRVGETLGVEISNMTLPPAQARDRLPS